MFRKRKEKKAEKQETPKKKKKRGGFKRLVFLLVVAGGVALAVSEQARNKVLDKLFGSEEEFKYTPPAPSGDGAGDAPA